jgi:glucose/arabinose dehydrogenase
MGILKKLLIALLVILLLLGGMFWWLSRGDTADLSVDEVAGTDPTLQEPDPQTIPTVAIAEPVGWGEGEVPAAAEGLAVARFADGLDHPRVLFTLPNGDVLVTLTRAPKMEEPQGEGGIMQAIEGFIAGILFEKAGSAGTSPNQIVLLRDADGDGVAETKKVIREEGLDSPSGLGWHDGTLYVANHDALLSFPYELGSDEVSGEPTKLMDLPPGGNHWMRNLVVSPDGNRIFVAVGSASNIGERGMNVEQGRAAIWEYNLETNRQRQFATGLRNANGLAFSPWSGELWTTVNERDMLGSDLVPDYLTNVPVGAQYGWPWIYWGDTFDRRVDAPIPAYLSEYARRPEYAMGPHVAALGLAFTREGHLMGDKFSSGAFIARHGSWNRKPPSGYDVVYVAFDERGNPQGKPVPVLSGFLTGEGTTKGRPTWVEWAGDGALLVSDDTAGIIWRVAAPGAAAGAGIERISGKALRPQRELTGDPRASFGQDDYARVEPAQ